MQGESFALNETNILAKTEKQQQTFRSSAERLLLFFAYLTYFNAERGMRGKQTQANFCISHHFLRILDFAYQIQPLEEFLI